MASDLNTPPTSIPTDHLPTTDDGSSAPKPKRQKVTIACDECRTKKIKCDGVRPVCQPCLKKYGPDAQCNWGVNTGRGGGISRDYIMQLEDRIRELERGHANSSVHRAHHNGSTDSLTTPLSTPLRTAYISSFPTDSSGRRSQGSWSDEVRNAGMKRGPLGGNEDAGQPPFTDDISPSQPQWQSALPTTSNPGTVSPKPSRSGVVTAMMGAVLDEDRNHAFFRGSSAGSFIKQIRKAIDGKIESPRDVEPSNSILDEVQLSMPMPERKSRPKSHINYVLPPRTVADSLMALFWQNVHPLYPYLDRHEIETAYQSLWSGQGGYDEPMFLCMLNIIFALSCQLSTTIKPEQRGASSEVFFVRAQETLNLNMWQVGSFQSVQAFLLLSQYLQSTNDPHQCWLVIGVAIRTAQSLGLHLPETSENVSSPRARELLRKVWHGCVLQDRFLSMSYGRPAMIGKRAAAAVPVPLAVDEERLSGGELKGDFQPAKSPSLMDFFIQSLGLYRIMNDILLSVYAPDPKSNSIDDLYECLFPRRTESAGSRSFLDLDRELNAWARNLPSHLRVEVRSSGNETHARQAMILRQRYLHVKILLLRPILSRFVISPEDDFHTAGSTLPYRIALQCSIICTQTAQEAIEHIHSKLPLDPGAVGSLAAWWFNVYFIYTAATVLLAARLRPTITAEVSDEAIIKSWNQAIEVLNRYEKFSASAGRMVATLQILFDKVPQRYMQQGGQAQQMQAQVQLSDQQSILDAGQQWPTGTTPWTQDRFKMAMDPATGLPQDAAMGTSYFDKFDFNFDPNDVSWLNSVPFYQT